jgi:tetratricopeptide (TPR) repeat protein
MDDAVTYNNWGVEYANNGDFDKAIECYNKIVGLDPIGLNPADAITLNNLGNVYQELGNYDEATYYYQSPIDLIYFYFYLVSSVEQFSFSSSDACCWLEK